MKNSEIIRIENLKVDSDTFVIKWNMTKLCNYYCKFCIQGSREEHLKKSVKEANNLRKEICSNLINFIENKLNYNYKKLKIILIGGEVTILSDFYDILNKIVKTKYDGYIEIKIKTNLSFNDSLIKKLNNLFLIKNSKKRRLIISASYYKEFTSEKEFINKIKKFNRYKNDFLHRYLLNFRKSNIKVIINYPLIHDSDYDLFLSFKRKYTKIANSISYTIIKNYIYSVSDEIKKLALSNDNNKDFCVTLSNGEKKYFPNITKIGHAISDSKNVFDPSGYLCDAGVNNLYISNDGRLFRCSKKIDEILSYDLIKNNIRCKAHNCNCYDFCIIRKDV